MLWLIHRLPSFLEKRNCTHSPQHSGHKASWNTLLHGASCENFMETMNSAACWLMGPVEHNHSHVTGIYWPPFVFPGQFKMLAVTYKSLSSLGSESPRIAFSMRRSKLRRVTRGATIKWSIVVMNQQEDLSRLVPELPSQGSLPTYLHFCLKMGDMLVDLESLPPPTNWLRSLNYIWIGTMDEVLIWF